MPICIAGMHRSGTSMYAKLLRGCGVYLGEDQDLLPPSPENPKGYWEHAGFVEINDDLLNALGGSWDHPPVLANDLHVELFTAFAAHAAPLLETFRNHEPWGWKDPRNSLTLPFWLDLFPDMKVVICVRNPIEVSSSLRHRSQSTQLSLFLWYHYNQTILRTVPLKQRIVTHYDQCIVSPQREMRRIADYLNLPISDERLSEVCAEVRTDLRHHMYTVQDLYDLSIAPEIIALYTDMCAEAGLSNEAGVEQKNQMGIGANYQIEPVYRQTDSGTPSIARIDHGGSEIGTQPSSCQDGASIAMIGRFDRKALEVAVLRKETAEVSAQLAEAQDDHEKQDAWARELERRLATVTEGARAEHEKQDAWARELERRLATVTEGARAEHEKQDAWARELERRLAIARDEHQRLLDWAHELQRQLVATSTAMRDDHEKQDAWARELERRLATVTEGARAEHEKQDAWARELERRLAMTSMAAQDEQERTRSLMQILEQRLATAEAMREEYEQQTMWARDMEYRLTVRHRGRLQNLRALVRR